MKVLLVLSVFMTICSVRAASSFQRVGRFYVCSQIDDKCNTSTETSAEIVAASDDGNTIVYTDSPYRKIGFVNITDPKNPTKIGLIDTAPGEPTSVAVRGAYALVAINTSPNFTHPSGYLAVVEIATRQVVRNITLPGQPDSVTVNKLKTKAAIAIENERNEALPMPQLPAGSVVLLDVSDNDPNVWTLINVDLTNLSVLFNTDPEPEYVAFNDNDSIVVTLQENNGIAIIASDGSILNSFLAGNATVTEIDNGIPSYVSQNFTIDRRREPDGVTWIDNFNFATADEGDLFGGSRGFTIFNANSGAVVFEIGNKLEWIAAQIGNYPEVSFCLSDMCQVCLFSFTDPYLESVDKIYSLVVEARVLSQKEFLQPLLRERRCCLFLVKERMSFLFMI
jgi:hypothetical protein